MMTILRKRVRIIMIVVAVAFIGGFLLGEVWRMLANRQTRGDRRRTDTVGQVGTHKVTTAEYRNALAYITDKYREDNRLRDLSSADYFVIEDQTWAFLVSELTWSKLLEDAEVRITQEEVIEIMRANPPEELRSNPELLDENGQFSQQKYSEVMDNPQNQAYFARYFRDLAQQLPKEKFRIDVANSYRMTGAEIEETSRAEYSRWQITSLGFGPRSLAQSVEPTDEEAEAYYKAHRDDFRSKETRHIQYVLFPIQVSAEDSAEARETVDRAHQQLGTGESFNVTMMDYSDLVAETTSAFFPRERLDAETDTVVSRLQLGEYSEPFLTTYGWQIVMLDSTRTDSVAMRRILVRIKLDGETVAVARETARDFIERAGAGSTDFDTVAVDMKLTVRKTRPMIDGEANLAGLSVSSPTRLADWARTAKTGVMMDTPLRGQDGLYLFQLDSIEPAGIREFEVVKRAASWRAKQEQEKKLWLAMAEEALDAIRAGKTMEQYAEEHEGVELNTEEFAGVMDCRRRRGAEFAGAVSALETGGTAGVIEATWGAFILRCDESHRPGIPVATQQLAQQRQQQVAQQVMQQLTVEQDVKDNRDDLFY